MIDCGWKVGESGQVTRGSAESKTFRSAVAAMMLARSGPTLLGRERLPYLWGPGGEKVRRSLWMSSDDDV